MRFAPILLCLLAANASGSESLPEHPLTPVLKLAYERLRYLDTEVHDYTGEFVKRERIDGRLLPRESAQLKIRHAIARDGQAVPFAVYVKFLGPSDLAGREVIYVAGRNNGDLIARRGGVRLAYFTTAVDPSSELAMQGNRYPITEIGIRSLIQRLIEVGAEDVRYGECDVKYYQNVTVDQRPCTLVEVTHPVRRTNFRYHIARIFIDDELQLPIRYASYDWADQPGGEPPLIEEYTYLKMKFNVGLTDADFDSHNAAYGFGTYSNP